ncbi:hypothetical protein SFHH103_01642 [Sinorhizobium fredii HH103]|uniref:Uncharacterized protein n=1 Tax=Sinorhizobium fredii (strain HH103) TaxID=1117943 RepID=G9A7A9_SINF1|nr:hypothetical protein [Sinorhizobium fredii]CCE96139.1 hypothetical protein SFHH103_01642 [Sinorhizobium fredii HH103]
MPERLKTLAEFTKPHMVLICTQCDRKGRYNVARLIEKHGEEMPIRDFIDMIGQSCHRRTHPTEHQRCGLGCDDLIYMFMPKPAADGYAEKLEQNKKAARE